jgi:hypothetical protein
MPRCPRARAIAVVLAFVAAGCQNYNFNPVGHCVVQPGSQSFTLSNVSSADVLFVVDDSNSMAGKQDRLAASFDDFIENLTSANQGRAQAGLLPLDFHIATTTTSVFYNRETPNQVCRRGCAGAGDKLACCVGNSAQFRPRACRTKGATAAECPAPPAGMAGSQTTCSDTCYGLKGELFCCNSDGSFAGWMLDYPSGDLVTCEIENLPCGDLQTHYAWTAGGCDPATQGVALRDLPFPDGAFVGSTSVSQQTANPRVLHFDKRLYLSPDGKNAQGFTLQQLKTFFTQNVKVGTCGSAQEQGLVASRHALEKALSGLQKDTYEYDRAAGQTYTPGSNPAPIKAFSAPNGIPAATAAAVWPNPGAKLVVVYLGDEDDCSSPKDPAGGVVLENTDVSGADACVRDADPNLAPPPLGGKQIATSTFVDYFTGLGRDLGAAFVISARSTSDATTCTNDSCVAQNCCDLSCYASCPVPATDPSALVCGGQAPGTRFIDTAKRLKAKDVDVVVGSVCGDFRPILNGVAEIVKPPQTLSLPSAPAEQAIAILRIATPAGETRKICGRPLPPVQPNGVPWPDRHTAEASGADWWFTKSANPDVPWDPTVGTSNATPTVAIPTKFVYINPSGNCKANPGETYSADYLGVVPADGCTVMPEDYDPAGRIDPSTATTRLVGSTDCKDKLGGHFGDWECYVPPPGPPVVQTGTCSCRSGG